MFGSNEEPVSGSKLGGADGVFDEVVIDFDPAVAEIGFKVRPLVEGVDDGFAQIAFGEDGAAQGEPSPQRMM